MKNPIKQGEALFAEGKIEEVEKCFLDFLDQNPEDAEAFNNLGVIHHTRGNVQEAEGYFLKAVEAKEDYPDFLLSLSNLYQNAKRWEEGAIQLEKYITIDNQDHNIFNQLGMIYLEMDDTVKALPVLKKSLELNPEQKTVRDALNALKKQNLVEMASGDQIREDYSHHQISKKELPKTVNLMKEPTAPRIRSQKQWG